MAVKDDGFQLSTIVLMPRGMTEAEAYHYLTTGELPPFGDPVVSNEPLPTPTPVGMSPGEAWDFLTGRKVLTAAGFDPEQDRDAHGRWSKTIGKITGLFKGEHHFPKLTTSGAFAMQRKIKPDGFSKNESDTIHFYTGSGYEKMNASLRPDAQDTGGYEHLSDKKKQAVHDLVGYMRGAMRPSDRNMLLVRGATPTQLGLGDNDNIADYVGRTFTDRGFMSTTITPSALNDLEHDLVFEIEAPKGTKMLFARRAAVHPEEDEMIIAPGTKFKITGVRDGNGDYDGARKVLRLRIVGQD